ncbi:hypothetical protein BDW67DRAFT_180771 [Aspergillus spinulosporus]
MPISPSMTAADYKAYYFPDRDAQSAKGDAAADAEFEQMNTQPQPQDANVDSINANALGESSRAGNPAAAEPGGIQPRHLDVLEPERKGESQEEWMFLGSGRGDLSRHQTDDIRSIPTNFVDFHLNHHELLSIFVNRYKSNFQSFLAADSSLILPFPFGKPHPNPRMSGRPQNTSNKTPTERLAYYRPDQGQWAPTPQKGHFGTDTHTQIKDDADVDADDDLHKALNMDPATPRRAGLGAKTREMDEDEDAEGENEFEFGTGGNTITGVLSIPATGLIPANGSTDSFTSRHTNQNNLCLDIYLLVGNVAAFANYGGVLDAVPSFGDPGLAAGDDTDFGFGEAVAKRDDDNNSWLVGQAGYQAIIQVWIVGSSINP